jgi:hypothetical protein
VEVNRETLQFHVSLLVLNCEPAVHQSNHCEIVK